MRERLRSLCLVAQRQGGRTCSRPLLQDQKTLNYECIYPEKAQLNANILVWPSRSILLRTHGYRHPAMVEYSEHMKRRPKGRMFCHGLLSVSSLHLVYTIVKFIRGTLGTSDFSGICSFSGDTLTAKLRKATMSRFRHLL